MWRRKQKVYKGPRLHFVNEHGDYVTEYLPTENLRITNWLRDQYLQLRKRLDWDIYYWHFRHTYEPEYRKVNDVEFINHVKSEHQDRPDDRIERRHYNWAWQLYGHEINFVKREWGKDNFKKLKNVELQQGHPYAYAYVERWYRQSDPNTKALYHGLKLLDYLETSRDVLERIKHQNSEYIKKHGLDPETGLKLKHKKKKG